MISVETVDDLRWVMFELQQSSDIPDKTMDKIDNVIELCTLLIKEGRGAVCASLNTLKYLETVNQHLFYIELRVFDLKPYCGFCDQRSSQLNCLVGEVSKSLGAKNVAV